MLILEMFMVFNQVPNHFILFILQAPLFQLPVQTLTGLMGLHLERILSLIIKIIFIHLLIMAQIDIFLKYLLLQELLKRQSRLLSQVVRVLQIYLRLGGFREWHICKVMYILPLQELEL